MTFNQFQLCKPMVSALPSHVPPGMRYKCAAARAGHACRYTHPSLPLCAPRFEAGDSREAKFYMLRRNASVVQTALDRMRTQRYKFICLNDDMNEQDQEAEAVRAAGAACSGVGDRRLPSRRPGLRRGARIPRFPLPHSLQL